jgi:23S rRNA G2445 N2-methylase RlmL
VNPITARPMTLELYGAPGTLPEVAAEARAIIAAPWKPHKFTAEILEPRGFVRVRGASWDLACEIAARASTMHDVRLAFPAVNLRGWDDVEPALERLPWGSLLPEDEMLEVRAEAGSGLLPHAGRLQRITEEFFAARGMRIGREEPFTRLEVETGADRLRVRVSLGNDALHKRGWRAETGTLATLREDLASAALRRLAAWEPRALEATRISVPFAGSGTLGVEAWHALFGLPPAIWGASRPWQRLAFPTEATLNWWWRRVVRAARDTSLPAIIFIENDAPQMQELEANLENVTRLLEEEDIALPNLETLLADVFALEASRLVPAGQVTLMPLHPPYGLRLSRGADIEALYAKLGRAVKRWTLETDQSVGAVLIGFCLCPSLEAWRAFQAGLDGVRLETSHVTQGGLDVRVCCFSSLQA